MRIYTDDSRRRFEKKIIKEPVKYEKGVRKALATDRFESSGTKRDNLLLAFGSGKEGEGP